MHVFYLPNKSAEGCLHDGGCGAGMKARGHILLVEWGTKAVIRVNNDMVEFTSALCANMKWVR